MRRAVPVIVATAGGLVLLANFKTSPASPTARSGGAALDEATTTTSTSPSASRPTSTTTAPKPTTTAASGQHRNVEGPLVRTRYGNVQVRVVVTGRHIDDVQALVLPDDRERSAEISDEAGPELRSEALKAQSADIDIVSGATYTSEGYIRSLQGAIDANH